jgi:hypothetical protein
VFHKLKLQNDYQHHKGLLDKARRKRIFEVIASTFENQCPDL